MKEGTLIDTVDIGATSNTGYCTTIDGRDIKVFKFGNTRDSHGLLDEKVPLINQHQLSDYQATSFFS